MGLKLKTINLGIEEADSPPSQSYFESFRDSLLLELKTKYLEIEKYGFLQSQLHFERVRDSLLSELESTNFEIEDRDSVFEGLDNSLLSALETISEVDSPRSQLIFERLQLYSRLLYFDAKFIGKRIYGSQSPVLDRLYLYFWHSFGRITYSLYEIKLPNPIHYPPTKATQDAEIRNPSPLRPILELETSKYPDGMCCVQFGPGLYFFGGKFNIDKPYIGEDEKAKFMNGTRNVLPRDVYFFNFTLYNYCPHSLRRLNKDMLFQLAPMNYGKASPQAFVVSSQIFVIGSNINIDGLDDEDFAYFEVYDTFCDRWTVLPNPPIRGITWVGNAVVESGEAILVGILDEQRYVFCFNLDTRRWRCKCCVRDCLYLHIFSGKTEFVGNGFYGKKGLYGKNDLYGKNGFYGCYRNTVVHLAVTSFELRDVFTEEEVEEEEGGEEEDQFQQVASLLSNRNRLRMVSKEKGMDAIYNVPRQLQSSSTLLHLGSGYFCYVRTGKPPPIHDDEVDDEDIPCNRNRFTSIVIFQTTPRETYEENIAKFFRAQFVYSTHYTFHSRFGEDLFIKGCYAHGPSEPLG